MNNGIVVVSNKNATTVAMANIIQMKNLIGATPCSLSGDQKIISDGGKNAVIQSNGDSLFPSIDRNGDVVAFTSYATNITTGVDAANTPQAYVARKYQGCIR